jgi:uncharacterized protein (UPF0332 family)
MPRASAKLLRLVATSKRGHVEKLLLGVRLVETTGYSIRELQQRATSDRLSLARTFLGDAEALHDAGRYRSSVSRAYYAMYQCFRAIVYCAADGDDHEAHQEIPKHIPADFPSSSLWQNELKDARTRRNDADYDPYPRSDGSFMADSEALIAKVKLVLPVARAYLRAKGFVV